MWNSSTGVNDACIAASVGQEWRCIFAQYTYPHIATPTFIAEGAYDSWQMGNILKMPCHDCSGGKCKSTGCPAGTKANCCSNPDYTKAFLAYGALMKTTISEAIKTKPAGQVGAFVSACIVHCQTIFNEGWVERPDALLGSCESSVYELPYTNPDLAQCRHLQTRPMERLEGWGPQSSRGFQLVFFRAPRRGTDRHRQPRLS